MALLEVRTEWAVYKNCFLQVAKYQADNSRATRPLSPAAFRLHSRRST